MHKKHRKEKHRKPKYLKNSRNHCLLATRDVKTADGRRDGGRRAKAAVDVCELGLLVSMSVVLTASIMSGLLIPSTLSIVQLQCIH